MLQKESTTASSEAAQGVVIPNSPFRFLWFTTKPFWPWLLFGVSLNVTTQILNTYTAVFIGNFADEAGQITDPSEFAWWSFGFAALLAVVFFSFRASGFVVIKLVLDQQTYAFRAVKNHLFKHSHNYFINRFAGTLAGKVFHAGDRSGELLVMSYYGFIRLFVGLLSTGVVIALFSWWLALAYLLMLIVTIVINMYLVRRRRPMVLAFASASTKYRGQMTDVVTNIQAVRQYSQFKYENTWLNSILDDRIVKDRRQWSAGEWNHVINNALTVVIVLAVIGGMYWLLVLGQVTAGAMITVMVMMYRVSGIIVDLGDWMNRLIRVYGDVEEGLNEVVIPHEIVDAPDAVPLRAPTGKIDWQKVNFKYDNKPVFTDFSLTIEPGQRVGLVGPSGAGKTTFVSLLLRQHDLHGGAIIIDGYDIARVTQDSLREHIAVVPQEPLLFHRSIRENIAYGKPDASEEEIIEVAKKAQAHDFIMELPEQYDTLVGERGVKLSGGQKQRVAIARAMLKDAPILVLDEATSALDSESEVAIQEALHELMVGKTVVAIAHRLSTLREMDRILVLDNGEIVEDGTHESLKDSGGTYARLWAHQAGGFLVE